MTRFEKAKTLLDRVNQYRFKGQESINNQANEILMSRIQTNPDGAIATEKELQYLKVISHLFYVSMAWVHDN